MLSKVSENSQQTLSLEAYKSIHIIHVLVSLSFFFIFFYQNAKK